MDELQELKNELRIKDMELVRERELVMFLKDLLFSLLNRNSPRE